MPGYRNLYEIDPDEVIGLDESVKALFEGLTSRKTAEALLKIAGRDYIVHSIMEIVYRGDCSLDLVALKENGKSISVLVIKRVTVSTYLPAEITMEDIVEQLKRDGHIPRNKTLVMLEWRKGEPFREKKRMVAEVNFACGVEAESAQDLIDYFGPERMDQVLRAIDFWRNGFLEQNKIRGPVFGIE